ncbi:MAG: hypothetical protein HXY34_10080 [Candidatus Thorarchaeota archaeon]|nr:hypothetical protein [Candidatus Thorarchaeota archaeon]
MIAARSISMKQVFLGKRICECILGTPFESAHVRTAYLSQVTTRRALCADTAIALHVRLGLL